MRGDITAATLRDDLFLVHYDCAQLDSCLGSHVLRANLDPLLQHPLPAECQRVVKAKLALVHPWWGGQVGGLGGRVPGLRVLMPLCPQTYPRGVPEEQLRRMASLVYLYSCAEIGQWDISSMDTLVALLASDAALNNQTEVRTGQFSPTAGLRPSPLTPEPGPMSLLLTPSRPSPGRPAEVPGPQRHPHRCPAGGHRGLPPLLDEPETDPDHQALGVPVSCLGPGCAPGW